MKRPATSSPPPSSAWPAWLLGFGLTLLFWPGLWLGGGLIGGDIYSYALPQKTFLADALAQGRIPFWNDRTGLGYPLIGESQTAAYYPFNLLAYWLWDVPTATNVIHLVQYVLAFVATWWFARVSGLKSRGALLAAVVYVYGWFPARASLDWAILGGIYLPASLASIERYLQTSRPRYLLLLALMIGLQLLGGHYQIAFFTWLTLGVYGAARLSGLVGPLGSDQPTTRDPSDERTESKRPDRRWVAVCLAGGYALGVLLGAAQLVPTWQLKNRSQRQTVNEDFLPLYGHLPPAYLTQVVAPWLWYGTDIDLDSALQRLTWAAVPAATNRAEAHLYFGQVPFYLALVGVTLGVRQRRGHRLIGLWLILAGLGIAYATGWPVVWFEGVPGVSYFRGPARATIVTTLMVGLVAGLMLDRWLERVSGRAGSLLFLAVLTLTVLDLWWTPSSVCYAVTVSHPPIQQRQHSIVRKLLNDEPGPVRLFAPGQNLPNLLGVSALPVYLGLGPSEYFDPRYAIPPVEPNDFHTYSPARVDWLRAQGVTHVLSFEPLERRGWPVEHLWTGFDLLLSPAWARYQEPLHLYRLKDALGRVRWEGSEAAEVTVVKSSAEEAMVRVNSRGPGRVVLSVLHHPGWELTVDGQVIPEVPRVGMSLAAEVSAGTHELIWYYRPYDVYWGLMGTGLAVLVLVALTLGEWRRNRPAAIPSE